MHSNTLNNNANLYAPVLNNPTGTLHNTSYLDTNHTEVTNPLVHYFSNSNLNANTSYLGGAQNMNTTPYVNAVFNGSSSSSSSSCSSSSDTLIADLDFLITTTNTSNNSTTNNRNNLNSHNQRYTNLSGNQRNIAHSNIARPPPLTTPAIHTSYQHDDQHQHIEEDHQNNLYSSFNTTINPSDQHQNSSSLLETNLLISAQNCLANTDFSSYNNNTDSDSVMTTAKNSIDLTNDLDSILLDTHAIGNNTANYFIESMQALHNLDTPHHLNLGGQSFTHLTSHGVPLAPKASINRGINNSTASSSSSASSSTANSSVINSSVDEYNSLIQAPLDTMSNSSSVAPNFLSKSHNFSDVSLGNVKKMKTTKNKPQLWDTSDYQNVNRKRSMNINSRSLSTTSDYNDSLKTYSMPSTPNNGTFVAENNIKRFKYEAKHDETEGEAPSTYPKYKRYDEFKCWVCGDQSSGNHYGALTCEACKLFFRRHSTAISTTSFANASSPSSINSSSSNEPKILTQCAQRNCQITVQTRSSCPECRYRKCIAVGMGLNRTTFGRHTTVQKVRYNTRVTDLFAEIMKLFMQLKDKLNSNQIGLSKNSNELLLIPNNTSLNLINQSASNLKIINNKNDLESNLSKFYNEVIDLMTPVPNPKSDTKNDIKSQFLPLINNQINSNLSTNTLVAFCLIFGYNLKINIDNENSNRAITPTMNVSQIQHICKQIKDLDDQFSTFAMRIKIIYFLLIMYTSHSANSLYEQDSPEPAPVQQSTPQFQSNYQYLNQYQSNYNYNYVPSTPIHTTSRVNYFEEFIEDTSNIQRTFLDLLNSELDFQQNTVSSARVSLLLKLDQFV